MTSFVSEAVVNAEKLKKKDEKRKAREDILKEARQSFERDKKRIELKRERGDDQWLAPGVNARLSNVATPDDDKKHGRKHKKRKEKASDDGSDDEEATWVEIDSNKNIVTQLSVDREKSPPSKRDDWMLMPIAPSNSSMTILNSKQTRTEQDEAVTKLQCSDKPGQHPLELNPYWKGGGSGLPEKDEGSSSVAEDRKPSSSKVNAAGRSWMLRAYKRALEQAEEEGRDLEDIATERWGSLDKLYSLLENAGIDPKNPDASRASGKDYLYSGARHASKPTENDDKNGDGDKREKPLRSDRGGHEGYAEGSKVQGLFVRPGEGGPHGLKGSTAGNFTSKVAKWRKEEGKQGSASQLVEESHNLHHYQKEPDGSVKHDMALAKSELMHTTQAGYKADDTTPPSVSDTMEGLEEPVTDMQLNAVSAKILKAEMIGDDDKVKALQMELEVLRTRREVQHRVKEGGGASVSKEDKMETGREDKTGTVVLTRVNRFGNVEPFDLPSTSSYRSSQPTHSKKGKRERYFHDDDRHSLRDLLEQERVTTAEDTHAMVARMASKFVPASHLGETVDDLIDSKSAMRSKPGKEEEKQRQKAVLYSRRMTEVLENCKFCVANQSFEKHLMVAMGIGVYLCVPSHESLTEGHCLLVPTEHTTSALTMDENIWSEVRIFQKGLTKMFSDRGMDVVFMETYMSAKGMSHMSIDCIPLPQETGAMAPMYFKKAILECDEEWAQNKKLVDTQQKGLRGSVPSGLPYFSVEFGLDNGFAHVIENTDKFPCYFGREVVGGMLDIQPRLWLKPHKESFEAQKRKVTHLAEWWKPYDWTQKLKQQ